MKQRIFCFIQFDVGSTEYEVFDGINLNLLHLPDTGHLVHECKITQNLDPFPILKHFPLEIELNLISNSNHKQSESLRFCGLETVIERV